MSRANAPRGPGRALAFLWPMALVSLLAACNETAHPGRMPQLGGIRTDVAEPKDFVRASRAGAPQDFIPVGITPPARAIAPRNEAGAAALEKELLADRARSQQAARRPLPRSGYDGSIPARPANPPGALLPQ